METYYYDGNEYNYVDDVLDAVRRDVDLNFRDSDFDDILRSIGGTEVDGVDFSTCRALKKHSYSEYSRCRCGIIDRIVGEIRDGIEMDLFPIRVPFTYGVIECDERFLSTGQSVPWDRVLYIGYRTLSSVSTPKNHPRYKSLMVREHLAEMVDQGLVTPTGLISHGRGEAFDYLMGERTLAPSLEAERAAAAYLLKAKRPVVCVNGNSIALDPKGLIGLARAVPAKMEVNIFHRTEERMEKLIGYMESQGAEGILGKDPDARIPGLTSDRALCTKEGIFDSDVIVVPIEDGDRAEALVAMGKIVISIDLNPLSRTSKTASVPISDEITRAVSNITGFVNELRGDDRAIEDIINNYSSSRTRKETIECICDSLMSEFGGE